MNKLIIIVIGFFVIAILSLLFNGKTMFVNPTQNVDIYHNLTAEKNTARTVKLMQDAQVTQTLQGNITFTVFAPTDGAYTKLPANILSRLADKNNTHDQIYTDNNHLVLGSYPSSTFFEGMKLTTVDAQQLTLTKKNGAWYINDTVKILNTDMPSKNGIIHTVDSVLIPTDF